MKKITLLFIAFFAVSFSFAQIDITFEEGMAVLVESTEPGADWTGVTEYTNFADQDSGSETVTTTVEAIPGGTTGNSSSRAMKVVENGSSASFHYPFISKGSMSRADGRYISLKLLPGEATGQFAIQFRTSGGSKTVWVASYNAVPANTWITLEFDLDSTPDVDEDGTGITATQNRLDLWQDYGTQQNNNATQWIDDIKQSNASVLSTTEFNTKSLNSFYNADIDAIVIKDQINGGFSIYNLMGQEVLEGDIANEISVETLKSGLYILSTEYGTLKFVK
ncbi:T9SS type A sorting domain-containing protein [Seonamhaeicola sp.]|uniref:T9SS type A sorting domain-containing protein n=1 Tax=Seonamhaeicola sp. TaxID=1912245 RepID=UPI0026321FF0|nr:T9SS type A sorting domain-containing protein [Seonamhaeicola sp.]